MDRAARLLSVSCAAAAALVGLAGIGDARADRADLGVSGDLPAVAHSGVRPDECGGTARIHAGRWERAKTPGLDRYCDLLAFGYAALSLSPDVAARKAEDADHALPGHAAPLVLAARAAARRGACEDARVRFERARALSAKSLDAPVTLHAYAVCALETGHRDDALAAYRTLVPRAELIGDRWEELSIFVEAAVLVMSQGKASLAEAIGYLTEARRRGALPGIGDCVYGALSLALDRAGRGAEAVTVAAEASGPSFLETERAARASGKPSLLPAVPGSELDAMIAILAERSDRELALERWQSYLASDAGGSRPFEAHARSHRDALGHNPQPGRAGAKKAP